MNLEKQVQDILSRRSLLASKKEDEVVEKFALSNESIINKGLDFLIEFTRFCGRYEDFSELPLNFVERIYAYNIEGVNFLEQQDDNTSHEELVWLYNRAGSAASNIFQRTSDVNWAINWFNSFFKCGELMDALNDDRAERVYCIAADGAKTVFEITKESSWAIKWYDSIIKSAKAMRYKNSKRLMEKHIDAGEAAYEVFKATEKIEWARKTFESCEIGASLFSKDRLHRLGNFRRAAHVARKLYCATDEIELAVKSMNFFFKSKELQKLEDYDEDDIVSRACSKFLREGANNYSFHNFARLAQDSDPHSKIIFSYCAWAVAEHACLSGIELDWARAWYDTSLNLGRLIGPKLSSISEQSLQKLVRHYEKRIREELSKADASEFFGSVTDSYENAAKSAACLYTITRDLKWADKCYEVWSKFDCLFDRPNRKDRAAMQFKLLADFSYDVFKETGVSHWGERALSCYKTFVKHYIGFKEDHDKKMAEIKSRMDSLENSANLNA